MTKRFCLKTNLGYAVKTNSISHALKVLVGDEDITKFERHWYTGDWRLSWAYFETSYGYKGEIVEVPPSIEEWEAQGNAYGGNAAKYWNMWNWVHK